MIETKKVSKLSERRLKFQAGPVSQSKVKIRHYYFSESSKIHLGDHDYDFTVVSSSGDNWVFSCETADDRDSWVEIIENMIKTR